MSFSSSNAYRSVYARFAADLGITVTVRVNNGTGFDDYPNIRAFKRNHDPADLIAGGVLQTNDVDLIILAEDLPGGLRPLERKDRITLDDGKDYAVIEWDHNTRTIGSGDVAVNATVRR